MDVPMARTQSPDDLIVEAAAIVTVDPGWRILSPGYIAVKDRRISALGPAAEGRLRSAKRRVEAPRAFLMPGMVNTHTHISMAAFRGACEDIPNRLTKVIFPLERDLVTRDLTYWSALYCLAEMARSGTTTFADMYYFEDEVAKATDKAGLRAILGETVLGHAAPDAPEGYGGIDYARNFIRDWDGHPRIEPCLAPHAPYTVDAEHLAQIVREAEKLDVKIMMHVAEMDFEHEKFSRLGGSVLRYLDSIPGLLSPRLLAVHMLYLDDADINLAAQRGLRVAHCPASNAKSGRLICPASRLQSAGVPLGLATDGPLSGNGMDMACSTSSPRCRRSGKAGAISSPPGRRCARRRWAAPKPSASTAISAPWKSARKPTSSWSILTISTSSPSTTGTPPSFTR